MPYHGEIIERLDSLVDDKKFMEDFIKDKSAISKAYSRGTIMSDMPSNDAWDIAKSHPLIVNMDYDKLYILSKIYNQQEGTCQSIPEIIDLLISPEFNSVNNAEQNLKLLRDKLREIYGRELQLLQYYEMEEKFRKVQQ